MRQVTVPDDAVVDGDDVWWAVDGERVVHTGHRRAIPQLGVEASTIDTGQRRLPRGLVALTEPCANAWCNRGHDMRYDEGHSRRCADCVDGKPLVQLVQHCQRRCIGKPRRHGDRVTAKLCDCGDGMVSLGVGTVEVLPVQDCNNSRHVCVPVYGEVIFHTRLDEPDSDGQTERVLDLAVHPGQYVVHWKRAG